MTMITPSYLGETIEYSSLHACRSTLEDPTTPERSHRFAQGSSGPFAEETYGPWRARDEIVRRYDDIRKRFLRAAVPLEQCWYDLHAS